MLKSKNQIGWIIISFTFIENLIEPSISILKDSQEAKNNKIRQSAVEIKHDFNQYKYYIKIKALCLMFSLGYTQRDFFFHLNTSILS